VAKPKRAHGGNQAKQPNRVVRDGIGLVMTLIATAISLDYFPLQLTFSICAALFFVDLLGQFEVISKRGKSFVLKARIAICVLFVLLAVRLEPNRYKVYLASKISGELNPPVSDAPFPKIQVGRSQGTMTWRPAEGGKGNGSVIIGFGDAGLIVERIDGKLFITGDIRGEDGNMVVSINNNRWYVHQSEIMDKNYTDNALEVFDKRGIVVLQIVVEKDKVKAQGEWWSESGTGVRLVENPDDPYGNGEIIRLHKGNPTPFPFVKAIFAYPSKEHQGELATQQH
jgi:hypothetical protein